MPDFTCWNKQMCEVADFERQMKLNKQEAIELGNQELKWYGNRLPPNTLTNADGTPYAAGHDSAIDQQKLKARRYAEAYVQRFQARSSDDIWIYEHLLKEHLEQFALFILKDLKS